MLHNHSMKTLIVTLMLSLVASNVNAYIWDDPNEPFDATKNRIVEGPISIEWRLAKNIKKECDKVSKQLGYGGFGKKDIEACAFWFGKKCLIITKKRPTMHTVGHEIRHCFYGEWH